MELNNQIEGTFEVRLEPVEQEVAGLGQMSIDKVFKGDLEGTSKGQMVSAMGNVKGSAGYVAIEIVDGTIDSLSGTFMLVHKGIMDRGSPSLQIEVIPDSGTGDFEGIAGVMEINIEEGIHYYSFDYRID